MDTRFWGPSGWRLLHLIAEADGPHGALKEFFGTLPYVLPCKFCRHSLSGYIQETPIEFPINKWLWAIHNKVNAKLRSQHLPVEPDPPFAAVRRIYKERLAAGCSRTKFEGWEFLFSIVENHPLSRGVITPMPDTPEKVADHPLERNRWNVGPPEERMVYYQKFWELLPRVLPFPEWRRIWASCSVDWSSRAAALKTLWGIRCRMESELELLNQTTYSSLCKELRSHRSGCSKSVRARTCRRKRVTPSA